MAHLLPHLFGLVLLFICMLLPYSNDYKAAWVFLLAPGQALRGFARGVHAALCLYLVVFPHLLIFLSFAWGWGVWHAGLFVAFSASLCFVYVAVEVRIIDGAPFSKQVDSMRSITLLPFLMLGAVVIAIVVGLQYFLVFRSAATVAAAAMGVAAAAYVLTRRSLEAFAQSIRYNLALLASESGTLYKEVDI
jgi:hypothetical protein